MLLASRRSAHERRTPEIIAQATECLLDELTGVTRVGVYASNQSELPTQPAIEALRNKGVETNFPLTQPNGKMTFHIVRSPKELRTGRFGILEPDILSPIAQELDAIVVPGVGFDTSGNRLGMGRGYYDRFLSKMQTKTVGFGYECQLIESVPVSKHDVPMHSFVSEAGIRNFQTIRISKAL